MSSQGHTYEVTLNDIPGRAGCKHVQVHDCMGADEARATAEAMYGGKATSAGNIYHTAGQNKSSNSGSSSDDGSVGAVVGVGALVLAFMFLPWVLMVAGGALGTWIGEKVTKQTMEEYSETKKATPEQNKKAAILLAILLFGGGFGFVSGTNIQNDWNSDTGSNVEQVSE